MNVVVTVVQDRRSAFGGGIGRHHDRVPLGLHGFGFETKIREDPREPVGRLQHLAVVRGVGTDRRNAEDLFEPREGRLEAGVREGQYVVDAVSGIGAVGHGGAHHRNLPEPTGFRSVGETLKRLG